jgi:hypothetical protein
VKPEPASSQNEIATDTPPVVAAPPTSNNQESRILAALGLSHGPLPEVQSLWLLRYYEYLAANLRFPFEAEYAEDIPGYRQVVAPITVTVLLHPDEHAGHEDFGLRCRARRGTQEIDVPLVDVEPRLAESNGPLIEDYWYWFWNWRFDPRI